jgi:hypothetical protein
MRILRRHTIKCVNDFRVTTGHIVRKGEVFMARVRCHHFDGNEVANIIIDEILEEGLFRTVENGKIAPQVSCNDFVFLDEIYETNL